MITLAVPRAGKVIADGSEIKRAKVAVRNDSRVRLEVELNSAAQKDVKRYGRIRANIRLSYVPRGSHAITKTVPLTFGYRNGGF